MERIYNHDQYVASVGRLVELSRELTALKSAIEHWETLNPNESRWDAAKEVGEDPSS